MKYEFSSIEKRWQTEWEKNDAYRVVEDPNKKPLYVLDMFPYPSGSGLHVGHPLGYIASDIYSRFMRLKGYNVLHPMGYDAFGLPAEQYAIETGEHPANTTEKNIARYREQLDKIGFSFDWSRAVKTSDPSYYRWTQWIFLQLFDAWYDPKTDKAKPIADLIAQFESNGSAGIETENEFTAQQWAGFSDAEKEQVLQAFRLAFISEATVNWCPKLGTVLANDEIKDGVSERGGYPVEQRRMKQWSLRISAYAERLLDGLNKVDFSDSLKEIQRNWIGKSVGAKVTFALQDSDEHIEVFTTRPDTIFGVSFMVLAPEHPLVPSITTAEQKSTVEAYQTKTAAKLERDRLADTRVSGAFTGAYAVHPLTQKPVPVWISDYVLASYGTGAVMAVPSGDERDWKFARHFGIDIPVVIEGTTIEEGPNASKEGTLINSDFLNGLTVKDAIKAAIEAIESKGAGKAEVNYRLRDAVFGRQRYWGEPIPVYYENNVPKPVREVHLPIELPAIDEYLPTADGDPPLGRATEWNYHPDKGVVPNGEGFPLELTTMPGWAGSSWYFLRYMDPHNNDAFVSKEASAYWGAVDVYLGGAEHATGHLLYFRFWTKVLSDLGFIAIDEPAQKLINQGMIQAEDGQKMSKRYGNVVNPDDVIADYGADTLRLHEMFLGPIEQHKPWNTKGIEGVHRFLKKYWRLTHAKEGFEVSEEAPTDKELKALHKAIKKVTDDNSRFAFNTVVSTLMVCVNELTELSCNKRAIIEPLTILMSPHCPYITQEIWSKMGCEGYVKDAALPLCEEKFLVESVHKYPISFNGKMRFVLEIDANMGKEDVEKLVLAHEQTQKYIDGKTIRKVIVVPKKIVNVVV